MTRAEQLEREAIERERAERIARERRRTRAEILSLRAFGPRVLRHLDYMSGRYVERAWYSQTECEIARLEVEDETKHRRAIQ